MEIQTFQHVTSISTFFFLNYQLKTHFLCKFAILGFPNSFCVLHAPKCKLAASFCYRFTRLLDTDAAVLKEKPVTPLGKLAGTPCRTANAWASLKMTHILHLAEDTAGEGTYFLTRSKADLQMTSCPIQRNHPLNEQYTKHWSLASMFSIIKISVINDNQGWNLKFLFFFFFLELEWHFF